MREPPAAPTAMYKASAARVALGCSTMTGEMEDSGRLPGRMKFAGDGMKPNALLVLGMLKSFISLLRIRPVSGTTTCEPKRRFTVVVSVMARPATSAETMCEVPGVSRDSRPLGS